MFIGEGQEWPEGEAEAWDRLARREAGEVCRNALADFDAPAGHYRLAVFGEPVLVSPADRTMRADSPVAGYLLNELPHYSRLAVLWYLNNAQEVPLSGNLVNPREVGGGLIFALGSHRLPLDQVVARYGQDAAGFRQRGAALGGEAMDYADAAVRIFPFPRVPVVLVLWTPDEMFPARVDLLFDASCSRHLPTDILWATAMMSALVMLR
ncbi:MAG: DUF3786 domain-containing protein [Chloroflexota bacterium]